MIDENIIPRRQLQLAMKQQQIRLDQPMSSNQIASLLQNSKWSQKDQECYEQIIQNIGQDSITFEKVIDQYINQLLTDRYKQLELTSSISALQENLNEFQYRLENTPDYPTAYFELVNVVCRDRPDNVNLHYKIQPSIHPGALLLQINDTVTQVNQCYTLQLPDRRFKVTFYSGGLNRGEWEFIGEPGMQNQQINQRINLENNMIVNVRVRYVNRRQEIMETIQNIQHQRANKQQQLTQQRRKANQLLSFRRYFFKSSTSPQVRISDIVGVVPDYRIAKQYSNVKNCYYFLQLQILSQCLASFCSPIPFISMIIPFYVLLKIHEITQNIKFVLGISILGQIMLFIYTILSLFVGVKVDKNQICFLYFNFVIQIGSVLMMGLVLVNSNSFKQQTEDFIIRKR